MLRLCRQWGRHGPKSKATESPHIGSLTMLYYAVVFLVIALIAALFGFGGIAAGAAGIAKILFIVFAVLAIATFLFGRGRG
jgi:uncharacterized membrane protein YtjA (UPF0391 family)